MASLKIVFAVTVKLISKHFLKKSVQGAQLSFKNCYSLRSHYRELKSDP